MGRVKGFHLKSRLSKVIHLPILNKRVYLARSYASNIHALRAVKAIMIRRSPSLITVIVR
jgi:hypothetical protein